MNDVPASIRSTPRAVVLDVDGTLYDQRKLRRAMLAALVRAHALRPVRGWKTASVLSAYRRAQEDLRSKSGSAAAQLEIACAKTGSSPEFARACVEQWMESAPLAFLPRCIQPGLREFLDVCRTRGVRLAALSDYPAEAKLEALGIAPAFELALSAQSAEIARFKPDPRGIQVTLRRLEVSPDQALYVGDRPEVDAPAAFAAGVACVIIGRPARPAAAYHGVSGYAELTSHLFRELTPTDRQVRP
jgi:FMN phosphatase YigB (HAD superfamily)